MTGPKGNGEFCFPETLNDPRSEAEGNIDIEGKQNSLFSEGPVMKVVYHLPKKSGNFGWNVHGKIIFFFPNGNFHGKTKFLER